MWFARVVGAAAMVVVVAASSRALHKTSVEEQGYRDVVVAISPSLDESQASALIAAITATVTAASKELFQATHNMLFFKTVKILIPKTWSSDVAQPATFETFEESDLRVDEMNLVYGDQPYVVQPGRCGDPGRYIHLTPLYLTSTKSEAVWGPRGKVLAQLWARLRWGVFDEVGYPGDPLFPLFYDSWNDLQEPVVKPNHCADEEIAGKYEDVVTGGGCTYVGGFPDENCRFVPHPDQDATTSLMSFANLDHIRDLCESAAGSRRAHDTLPPNRHNLLCEGMSAWEVMSQHVDFYNATELPVESFVSPEVVVVQQVGAKFALVLDHSGSMSGNKIRVLQNTAKRWLLYDVADGSHVAIINFANHAVEKMPLTLVSNSSRPDLAAAITSDASGGTCIGCGLRFAIEGLRDENNTVILLITDGENTSGDDINDVMEEVVQSGVRVVSIAYGNYAEDTLEELAQNTGGKTYIVPEDDDGSMMDDAFQGSLTYQPGDSLADTDIKIHESEQETNEASVNGTFIVDATVGRNLEFRLEADIPLESQPVLLSPSGDKYNESYFASDIDLWILEVAMAESGEWNWEAGLSDGGRLTRLKVTVTAQARDPSTMPIHTQAWMNTGLDYVNASVDRVIVYAKVLQGDNPVVGAQVRAYVTTPDTTAPAVELDLLDNGQGADVQEGDGVYCRYFTQYTETGRYAVKAQVWDEGNSFINNGFITSRRGPLSALLWPPALARLLTARASLSVPEYCCGSAVPFDPSTAIPTGNFTRNAAAGSFHVVALPAKGDSFPPDRVFDLLADASSSSLLTARWTAPGDDFDTGTVAGYEIRMSFNPKELLESNVEAGNSTVVMSFEEAQNITELLQEAGTVVSLDVQLDQPLKPDTLYFLALRAMDSVGNISPMSNVATALLQEVSPPPPPALQGWEIALIVIGSLVGVALLGVLGFFVFRKVRKT